MSQGPDGVENQDLFEHLQTHRSAVWAYLLHHVRNRADAEDLFQEVHLKAMRHFASLREPDRFRSWLFSITLNTVRNFFRQQRPQVAPDELPLEQLASAQPSAFAQLEREQQHALLRACLNDLPERDREILVLDVFAELPQQEIADQLNLNLNTVKTLNRRAKIKLARLMAERTHD